MIIHDFIASEGTGEFPFQFRRRLDNDDIVFTMTWPLPSPYNWSRDTRHLVWCRLLVQPLQWAQDEATLPSHSKVLHPTPDIGHNPDCVARVLTHPGSTRWCKVTQKLRRRRHSPTIVTSSTSDCRRAQASDKIQLLWLSRSQANFFISIFGDKNSMCARYHSEKHW